MVIGMKMIVSWQSNGNSFVFVATNITMSMLWAVNNQFGSPVGNEKKRRTLLGLSTEKFGSYVGTHKEHEKSLTI